MREDSPVDYFALLFATFSCLAWLLASWNGRTPLTIAVSLLGPTWVLWRFTISMIEGGLTEPWRWRAGQLGGALATGATVIVFFLSLQLVADQGLALDVDMSRGIERVPTPRQARGMFLVWLLPTVLMLSSAIGSWVAWSNTVRIARWSRVSRSES